MLFGQSVWKILKLPILPTTGSDGGFFILLMHIEREGDNQESQEGLTFSEFVRTCMAGAIVAVDAQKRITALNAEAEKLFNLKADSVLHPSVESLPAVVREFLNESLLTGQPVTNQQITLQDADGACLTLALRTLPILSSNGQAIVVFAELNDLTQAVKLDENMRQFDRLASIGTLSANMAHEIKNALVSVKTFVDLLLKRNQDAELAGLVSREMRRIDSILSQMLRFAGPAKPTFTPLRLNEVLNHSLRLIQHQLESRKIRLERSLAAFPDLIQGDDYQLEQAFINLFFNALEAMEPQGVLSVTTTVVPGAKTFETLSTRQSSQICITIRDTGIGISPENIGRLFEPFFTTKVKGTGLGLPITRRIIHEHNGNIMVESELNKGTTFTLLFPLLTKAGY